MIDKLDSKLISVPDNVPEFDDEKKVIATGHIGHIGHIGHTGLVGAFLLERISHKLRHQLPPVIHIDIEEIRKLKSNHDSKSL
jgi:hypothetical protein